MVKVYKEIKNKYNKEQGDGITDFIKNIASSATKKLTSNASKEIIKKSTEEFAKAAAKKSGEEIINKIFKDDEKNIIKNNENKSDEIKKELKKLNIKNNNSIIKNTSSIREKFNELL